jgi:hypothetical protein
MTTDRLALAHAIEEAGIERTKAEQMASAISAAMRENDAAKMRRNLMLGGLIHLVLGASLLCAALYRRPRGRAE